MVALRIPWKVIPERNFLHEILWILVSVRGCSLAKIDMTRSLDVALLFPSSGVRIEIVILLV